MTDEKIKEIIAETARATVLQLQAAGLLQDGNTSSYKKTEALLWQYPELLKSQAPYARRVVQEVDACLAEAENEPYLDVIRLFYFGGLKNAACAKVLACDERTARRNRTKLVQRFSARLAADDFIRELLR